VTTQNNTIYKNKYHNFFLQKSKSIDVGNFRKQPNTIKFTHSNQTRLILQQIQTCCTEAETDASILSAESRNELVSVKYNSRP